MSVKLFLKVTVKMIYQKRKVSKVTLPKQNRVKIIIAQTKRKIETSQILLVLIE
jgi:hypothetical protein